MAMAAITLGCTDNLPQRLSFDNNHLRAASFSSYLNCSDKTCGHKLAEKSANQNFITTTTPPHGHFHLGTKRVEDEEEIGVFGAEKYFNGGLDEVEEDPRVSKNGEISYRYPKDHYPVDVNPTKPKTGTPSNHSDSSWNSQSALLGNGPRNPPERKTNKRNGKGLLSALGVKCSCIINKRAVDTNEEVGVIQEENFTEEPLQNRPDAADLAPANKSRLSPWVSREDCFTFPILNSRAGNLEFKARLQEEEEDDDKAEQRKSLELFGGCPTLERKNKSLASSLERKLTELTWDYSNARREEIEIPGSCDGMYNDFESDASSDLFEIESFRNNNNNSSFPQMQASDGMSMSMSSCVTPTTCYAPSEASIEWSVVTARAADFSVISVSDQDLMMTSIIAREKPRKTGPNAKSTSAKEVEKQRSARTLLGCKSHKAVSVAGDAREQMENLWQGFKQRPGVRGKSGANVTSEGNGQL